MLTPDGSCRLCLVEIESTEEPVTACNTRVAGGMVARTDTLQVREERKEALKKLLAHHPCECLICERRDRCGPYDICLRNVAVTQRCVLCPYNDQCELQQVVDYLGLTEIPVRPKTRARPVDYSNLFFKIDRNYCVLCRKCVRTCHEVTVVGAMMPKVTIQPADHISIGPGGQNTGVQGLRGQD